MNIIIVEDDYLYAERLKVILLKYEIATEEYIYIYDNIKDTLKQCIIRKPDLIISDVFLLGDKTGIDLLGLLNNKDIPIILMTASVEKELYEKAKKIKKINYLIKPIQPLSLISTIEKILEQNNTIDKVNVSKQSFIIVKDNSKYIKIFFHDILWVESFVNYCTIVLLDKKITQKKSLKKLLLELDDRFIRCHQQFLVNMHFIKSISKDFLMVNKFEIPLGRTFRSAVHRKISSKVH